MLDVISFIPVISLTEKALIFQKRPLLERGPTTEYKVTLVHDRAFSFERNCVLRRWESETLK